MQDNKSPMEFRISIKPKDRKNRTSSLQPAGVAPDQA